MRESDHSLERLLEQHAAGQDVAPPPALADEFAQARAADAALRAFLADTASAPYDAQQRLAPPRLPPDYAIARELGRGGMGVVYLARQQSLQRDVAIKVLRPSLHDFSQRVERFLHEAQHLANLRHPHIVAIYEVGDAAGEPYFTMDYVDGEPLTQRLARGALSPSQAVDLFKQIASAVQHAHKQGIVHRDLKPGNILLDRQGTAFVTDFGLARQLRHDSTLTQSGEVLGTPQYMAPEQARGEAALVGEATDIHALGLLLYEMLTGRPTFAARSPADVLVKLLHHEPTPPRQLDRRVPRDLETICLTCLAKHPTGRYANVGALLEDVRRYEAGEPLAARRPSWPAMAWRRCRRYWRSAATAAVAALLSLVFAAVWFDRSYEDLIAWGDEELATGNADVAAKVYARAWNKADETQRRQLVERVAQTCRLSEPSPETLALALAVVEAEPTASFGELDFLVAQTLVARERAAVPAGAIDVWHARPTAALELVRQRLELALQRGVPADMRLETEETLAAVKLVLGQGNPEVRYAPDFLHRLPSGTAEQLRALADDERAAAWNRAKAAIALGRRLEADGDAAEAHQAYERAIAWIRQVYPYYRGVASHLSAANRPDASAEECRLVAELCADLARLAPNRHPPPTGGLAVALSGDALPPDVVLAVRLQLSAPEVSDPDAGLTHRLPRLVQFGADRSATVGVVPGRYRLRCDGHQARWSADSERFMRLFDLDTTQWPAEIVIDGDMLQLPPAVVRQLAEVRLTAPDQAAALDLNEAVFKWERVPDAAYYQVQFSYTTEAPHPASTLFGFVRTREPRLACAEIAGADRQALVEHLLRGRTGGWTVTAYDAADRRVGVALEERRFAVVEPLQATP